MTQNQYKHDNHTIKELKAMEKSCCCVCKKVENSEKFAKDLIHHWYGSTFTSFFSVFSLQQTECKYHSNYLIACFAEVHFNEKLKMFCWKKLLFLHQPYKWQFSSIPWVLIYLCPVCYFMYQYNNWAPQL